MRGGEAEEGRRIWEGQVYFLFGDIYVRARFIAVYRYNMCDYSGMYCLCVQRVIYILKVQLWYSCFTNYNGQYLWVTLVAQYRVTSVYFIAVYHKCVLRKGSKNTPNFDCNVV